MSLPQSFSKKSVKNKFYQLVLLVLYILINGCGGGTPSQNKRSEISFRKDLDSLKMEFTKHRLNVNSDFITNNLSSCEDTLITSADRFKWFDPHEPNWEFPFIWGDLDFPIQSCIILIERELNYYYFVLAYGDGSTGTFNHNNFLFTYSLEGEFIDFQRLPDFCLGKGDSEAFLNSNFVRILGSSGFSELKVSRELFYCNTSSLKLYNNGTEEVCQVQAAFELSDTGDISKVESDTTNYFFYKDGQLAQEKIHQIKRYSNEGF